MEHAAHQHTNTSNVNPIILTMDDHESHVSVDTMEYAKEHGVQAMTLPPHTSHKTQPLDRSVFGPLKNYFNGKAKMISFFQPLLPIGLPKTSKWMTARYQANSHQLTTHRHWMRHLNE